MGQFASIISLTWEEILTLTQSAINDESVAIADLELITLALNPRTPVLVPILPPPEGVSPLLGTAISDALTSASKESRYIYNAIFPASTLTDENYDLGVVLNYAPLLNDFKSLTNHLTTFFSDRNLPLSPAVKIAAKLQPEVMASSNTPSVTYGRVPTGKVEISDPLMLVEYLFWVAAFGIFQTGNSSETGSPQFAVIYSFRASLGNLSSTIQ
jgi:hypothetical protein